MEILQCEGMIAHKYTKSYRNLINLASLEEKASGTKFMSKFSKRILELEKEQENFHNGVPLAIFEQYFFRNNDNVEKYVYIEYKGMDKGEIKVIEMFEILEKFFDKIFAVAMEIADYYSYEIKFENKYSQTSKTEVF